MPNPYHAKQIISPGQRPTDQTAYNYWVNWSVRAPSTPEQVAFLAITYNGGTTRIRKSAVRAMVEMFGLSKKQARRVIERVRRELSV